jgi:hypothetical protein
VHPSARHADAGRDDADVALMFPHARFVELHVEGTSHGAALLERGVKGHTEPLAEFPVVRQCLPDSFDGGLQFDAFFNAVWRVHGGPYVQWNGCSIA